MPETLYHFNPYTGEVSPCGATKATCPFAWAMDEHFPTAAAASRAFGEFYTTLGDDPLRGLTREQIVAHRLKIESAFNKAYTIVAEKDRAEYVKTLITLLQTPTAYTAPPTLPTGYTREYIPYETINELYRPIVSCPTCKRTLTAEEVYKAFNQDVEQCSCGADIHYEKLTVEVDETNPTAVIAYDVDQAKKLTWYHSTELEDWEDALEDDSFFVHLGTEQAAKDRRISEMSHQYNVATGYWMHEIKLNPQATMHEEVLHDENQTDEGFKKGEITAYINRYEDLGSISCAAQPTQFTVVNSRWVELKETHKEPSWYNVPDPRTLNAQRAAA